MHEEQELIECSEHGRQQATFVCQHIVKSLEENEPSGFWWSTEDPSNPRPDAWCSKCEALEKQEGEWSEENLKILNVKLLCGVCYDNAKKLNLGES